MHLGWGVWLRALVLAAAVGLAWTGVGFLAYGLYLALIPSVGFAGAALLAAAACLVVAAILVTALVMRTAEPVAPSPMPVETTVVESNAMIKALSDLAQDHPIMAVCCAAILGATNTNTTVRRPR